MEEPEPETVEPKPDVDKSEENKIKMDKLQTALDAIREVHGISEYVFIYRFPSSWGHIAGAKEEPYFFSHMMGLVKLFILRLEYWAQENIKKENSHE